LLGVRIIDGVEHGQAFEGQGLQRLDQLALGAQVERARCCIGTERAQQLEVLHAGGFAGSGKCDHGIPIDPNKLALADLRRLPHTEFANRGAVACKPVCVASGCEHIHWVLRGGAPQRLGQQAARQQRQAMQCQHRLKRTHRAAADGAGGTDHDHIERGVVRHAGSLLRAGCTQGVYVLSPNLNGLVRSSRSGQGCGAFMLRKVA
jgi:hypothetical protein